MNNEEIESKHDESGYYWVRFGKFWTIGEHDITLMTDNREFVLIGHGTSVIVDEIGERIYRPSECKD